MAFVHLLPTSDISSSLFTQQTGKCADFEMRYVDCLEAYGYPHGLAKCQDYLDDLTECSLRIKQLGRVAAMKDERKKQYKAGDRPELWSPPPKPDAF